MRLNPAAFNRHLEHIGQRVLWRRSFACACANPATGQADPKHALCAGKGRLWDPPVQTVTGVASQDVQMKWAKLGNWAAGDTVLSVPSSSPLWNAGRYDRVTMLDGDDVFSQPLVRGAPTERLIFAVKSVTRCFWLDPVTRNIVEGGLPTVDEAGRLTWAAGGPPAGTTYSLTGLKHVEYFVFDQLPSDRNQHSGERLPKRIVARNFDLFSR